MVRGRSARPLIAVLGLGEMGLVHAQGLSRCNNVRVGVASRREDARRAAEATVRQDAEWDSYEAALADDDVAGVVIATPPPSHPDMIAASAAAGKFIFSEKPLGYGSEEVLGALHALKEHGIKRFMTGFMRRWDTGYRYGRDAVDVGTIGLPVALKCTSGDQYYPEKYRRPGAGAKHAMFKDLAVHDVDLARFLTQSEVRRVYATGAAISHPELKALEDVDMGTATLEMESGASALCHFGRALHYGYNVTSELVGTRGSVRLGDLPSKQAVLMKDLGATAAIPAEFRERFERAFELQMQGFAELVSCESDEDAAALMAGNPSYASAEDGLRATEVSEALVESFLTGNAVDVIRTTV